MKISKLWKRTHRYITDPGYRFRIDAHFGKYDAMPDAEYLKKMFSACMNADLHLDAPATFNEKLQWLKLYDRKPVYTGMVDKLLVRDHIAETIGGEYLIPLLDAWDRPEDIDFDALPNQFVLKCNHNSGLGMCICKDKSKLDLKKVKRELHRGLRQDYYLTGREWPYQNVSRKIIAETFLSDESGTLTDYKIHNFNGVPKLILVCRDRFTSGGLTEDFFDETWTPLDLSRPNIGKAQTTPIKPPELERMLELSKKLSAGIPFLRTDFYVVRGKVYFGELTFFPAGGFTPFVPEVWDQTLGDWLTLPEHSAL